MIHFDQLPNSNPLSNMLIPKGTYYGTISKAEMRQGKDPAKPPYLSITWDITDEQGNSKGKLFDIITEPTADLTKYKLKRFITGLKLPINGDFMLKDLVKIIINKKCIIDITIDEKSEPHRNTVDVFKGEIYYPIETAATTFENTANEYDAVIDDNMPWDNRPIINATDANDAQEVTESGTDTAPESNY